MAHVQLTCTYKLFAVNFLPASISGYTALTSIMNSLCIVFVLINFFFCVQVSSVTMTERNLEDQ